MVLSSQHSILGFVSLWSVFSTWGRNLTPTWPPLLVLCVLAPVLATKLQRWGTKLAALGSPSLMRLA